MELVQTDYGRKEGITILEKMLLPELQLKATAAGIDIEINPLTKTKPGWRGRNISLLSAAYACGWVDKNNTKSYQAMKYDSAGKLIKEFSLPY